MNFLENTSLKPYNTFSIDVESKYFASFQSTTELKEIISSPIFQNNKHLILGGGSNVLFTKNFDGIVIKNNIKGIEKLEETEKHIFLKVGAGEVWHEFVLYTIAENLSGIENLSLIPGSVGASPMQNIGAYGVEIKDVFDSLEAINIKTGELESFDNESCKFGYRESIFKNSHKDQYIITSVTYKLNKTPHFKTSYGAIQEQLKNNNVEVLSAKAISDAVIQIRESKLPNPKEIGNAGSFFKNPIIESSLFEEILKEHPNIPNYPAKEGYTKVAAGWLIEQSGLKGLTIDNRFGVHKKQALVLVNYKDAKGNEIFDLSEKVIQTVKNKFNIQLEREVNII